ncbi:heterokaryon incompatibility protein-domain-containing protein [Xylariales sp. AK1849]|nr:heterokaryon incompatibility protein-domain-containing protein [Xylariales sp. AK1849]
MHPVGSLCAGCQYDDQGMKATSAQSRRSGLVTVNIAPTRRSVAAGCWFCKALLTAMQQLWDGLKPGELDAMCQVHVRFDVERFTLRGQIYLPILQIYTPAGSPQVHRLIPDKELSMSASSTTSYNFIKYNLNKCVQSHFSCRAYQDKMRQVLGGGWPKRILKIDTSKSQVRLIDFQPAMAQKYTALSYCWGGRTKQVRATASTLPKLRKGFSISNLPRTIRDAIEVAVNLGSGLIWIDAMCIIQDDEDDWTVEASKMSMVYSNALVTIIASSAKSCDEGFLHKVRKPSILVSKVQVGTQPVEIRARVLRDWGHHQSGPQSPDDHQARWLDPVDSRGWILQERLLSARYISFTTGEVQWGCQTSRVCECGQPTNEKLYDAMSPEEQWFVTVKEYSTRHLEKVTDKLTALAGIARKMSTMLKRTWTWYGAGIWLAPRIGPLEARSLLWYRYRGMAPAYFPDKYTAPTFSWASVIGEVVHLSANKFDHCMFPPRIIDVNMETARPDEFGQVKNGYIRLHASLIRARLSLDKPSKYNYPKINGIGEDGIRAVQSCHLDGALERVPHPKGGFTVRRRISESLQESEIACRSLQFGETEVFVLPILLNLTTCFGEGVVLARSLTKPGYERIGVTGLEYDRNKGFTRSAGEEFDLY